MPAKSVTPPSLPVIDLEFQGEQDGKYQENGRDESEGIKEQDGQLRSVKNKGNCVKKNIQMGSICEKNKK